MSDIASSLEGRPSGCAPCPLQGGGRRPEKKPFVPTASPSTAPRASGTGPALRGPAAAQQFPHGREVSARWTKLSGQPAAEKEKAKHKLPACLPPQKARTGWEQGCAWRIKSIPSTQRPGRGGESNGTRSVRNGPLCRNNTHSREESVSCL